MSLDSAFPGFHNIDGFPFHHPPGRLRCTVHPSLKSVCPAPGTQLRGRDLHGQLPGRCSLGALESLVCSEEGCFCRHAPGGGRGPNSLLLLVCDVPLCLPTGLSHASSQCQASSSVSQLLCHSLMILKLVLLLKGWLRS